MGHKAAAGPGTPSALSTPKRGVIPASKGLRPTLAKKLLVVFDGEVSGGKKQRGKGGETIKERDGRTTGRKRVTTGMTKGKDDVKKQGTKQRLVRAYFDFSGELPVDIEDT